MKILRTAVLIISALVLAACGSDNENSEPTASQTQQVQTEGTQYVIGVSFPMTNLLFRAAMKEQAESQYYIGNTDKRAYVRIYDGMNSQEKQNKDLLDMINSGVDGIVLIPYTMEGSLSMVQYANEKGIPVITVDNTLEENSVASVISYVGADHYLMGKQAAELFITVLENRFPDMQQWNVIQLTGIPNTSGAVDRGAAIEDVFSGDSRINLLGSFNAEFLTVNAKSVTEDCLDVYDNIQGIICQNDLMAEGCYEALKERGMLGKIVIVGIDGQRSIVEKMVSGGVDGTVIQYPSMINEGIEILCDYLDGNEVETVYYQQTDKIFREDAQRYLDADLPW